jgi:hypothetical protein
MSVVLSLLGDKVAMAKAGLQEAIRHLLCDRVLGLNVFPIGKLLTPSRGKLNPHAPNTRCEKPLASPFGDGFQMTAAYLALFCGLQLAIQLIHYSSKVSLGALLIFQLYGAIWAGWATVTTKIAARMLLVVIETDITPNLSDQTAQRIHQELKKSYTSRRFFIQSWMIGVACAAAAEYLIAQDLGRQPISLELLIWAAGWSLLFATSAGVVYVGRFYAVFAKHIDQDAERCFALDASHSSLVLSVASLGRIMLTFWIGIAISISLVFPFSLWALSAGPGGLDWTDNLFALFDMAVAGFFSIGVGTIVLLQSEASIRRVVASSAVVFIRNIEDLLASLISRLSTLNADEWERVKKLEELREKAVAGSSYQTVLTSSLSIFMPFITVAQPIIAFLVK